MRRLRQDVDWLVSAGLLIAVAATAITGVIADLWDLNDFWYHTVAGYLMGAFAVAHVVFNWNRLIAYARFRVQRPECGRRDLTPARSSPSPTPRRRGEPNTDLRRLVLSRRGLLGFAIGGAGGWLLGRGLRPPPQIAAGSDVGVVYHEWSKPGIIDALGSVAN